MTLKGRTIRMFTSVKSSCATRAGSVADPPEKGSEQTVMNFQRFDDNRMWLVTECP